MAAKRLKLQRPTFGPAASGADGRATSSTLLADRTKSTLNTIVFKSKRKNYSKYIANDFFHPNVMKPK